MFKGEVCAAKAQNAAINLLALYQATLVYILIIVLDPIPAGIRRAASQVQRSVQLTCHSSYPSKHWVQYYYWYINQCGLVKRSVYYNIDHGNVAKGMINVLASVYAFRNRYAHTITSSHILLQCHDRWGGVMIKR